MNLFGCQDNSKCSVTIQTWYGKYITADSNHSVHANHTEIGEIGHHYVGLWDFNNKGDQVKISKSAMNKMLPEYLIAFGDTGGLALISQHIHESHTESKIWKVGNKGNGQFTFKSNHGKFLVANENGGLKANSDVTVPGDTFKVIPYEDPTGTGIEI